MPSVKQVKNDIIYYLIRGLIAVFDLLPRNTALMLGRFFGEVAAIIDVKERKLAESNLKNVYGEKWSDLKIKLVARECFVMLGLNAADVILSRRWTAAPGPRLRSRSFSPYHPSPSRRESGRNRP